MANEKDPTVKDVDTEAEGASTDTTEPLTAIFQGLDGKKIRRIISVGQAMLQERMAMAIDKVLSAHLQAFGSKSHLQMVNNQSVNIFNLYVKGVAWDDAATFLKTVAPPLAEGGVGLVARLRELGDLADSITESAIMELELVTSPGDHSPLLDILSDESALSTSEALDYLRSARAKRVSGDSPDE